MGFFLLYLPAYVVITTKIRKVTSPFACNFSNLNCYTHINHKNTTQ